MEKLTLSPVSMKSQVLETCSLEGNQVVRRTVEPVMVTRRSPILLSFGFVEIWDPDPFILLLHTFIPQRTASASLFLPAYLDPGLDLNLQRLNKAVKIAKVWVALATRLP